MIKNLSAEAQVRTGLDFLAASASADRNGAIFDTSGFEGVLMIFKFADIGADAVTDVKAQQDTDPAGGAMADLEGTSIAVAHDDDDQIFIIDLVKPRERYVRGVVNKDAGGATHVTNESLIYIGYGARIEPVTQTLANEVTYERHVSPAEGTA
jgi:hypothetical protein